MSHTHIIEKASVGLEAPGPVQKPGAPSDTQKPECTPLSTLKGSIPLPSEPHTVVW